MGPRAKGLVLAGLAVWALLAFVAWHYESSCGVFFAGQCLERHWANARNFVLLRWLGEYQTLLAGIGAIAGGAFVLISTRETISENRRTSDDRERRRAVSACNRVASEFREAQMIAFDHANSVQSEVPEFSETRNLLAHLYEISPELGGIVSANRRLIKNKLTCSGIGSDYSPRDAFALSCSLYHLLIHIAENLETNSTFDMDRTEFADAAFLKADLAMLGVSEERAVLVGIRCFFRW